MLNAELAERHVPLAKRIARFRAWNAQDLEDVYSDALYGLVRAARRYKPPGLFEPYARKFIEGTIQNGRRKRSGYRAGQVHLPPALVPLDDHLETIAAEEPVDVQVWEMVDALPGYEAAAVRLYYEQDLPQTEIAVMLGISQMHVSRLLSSARDRLRERIEDDHDYQCAA